MTRCVGLDSGGSKGTMCHGADNVFSRPVRLLAFKVTVIQFAWTDTALKSEEETAQLACGLNGTEVQLAMEIYAAIFGLSKAQSEVSLTH